MKILAIETSCDETGFAVLEATGTLKKPKIRVLKNVVSSQILIHRPFGGVVPNLAKREHLKNLPILLDQIAGETLAAKEKFFKAVDFITVTVGPGLEPALWTGITFAEKLAKDYKIPLVGANHLEGHLYSFLLNSRFAAMARGEHGEKIFPAVALIVSGGHTTLLRMESFSKWKLLGETRDDAAGEAFDKVARLLDLPYPGGPEVERLAAMQAINVPAHPNGTVEFPRPMLHDKNYDFSFSGLKTAVLYHLRDNPTKAESASGKADVAASFQTAAIDVLAAKTFRAVRGNISNGKSIRDNNKRITKNDARSVILCGGVAANQALRARFKKEAANAGCNFFVPDFKYNLDNAAMIGAAGFFTKPRKKKYPMRADGGMEI
jgi:N6-L-threonylcarbamoyladenine synthase